jgi:hypothetical protein
MLLQRFQAKSHHLVGIDAMGCYECYIVFVVGVQGYLMISQVAVEEAE